MEPGCVGGVTLEALLFGEGISGRGLGSAEALASALDACLRGVAALLRREKPQSDALWQATIEWDQIVQMPASYEGIVAKRAALLFALYTLEEVGAHFARTEPELVRDLNGRVLPMLVPRFVAEMCQNPQFLVACACVLHTMWRDLRPGAGTREGAPA